MKPSSEIRKPVPPCRSGCSSSSRGCCCGWPRRCCGPKKNSNGSPLPPPPPPKGETKRREDPFTISVEVIETTAGIVSSAMSAKEGSRTEPERARAGASRCASDRGVTLTELATTIPKMTAAAMSTENERARFVDFSMDFLFTPPPRPVRRDLVSMFAVHRCQYTFGQKNLTRPPGVEIPGGDPPAGVLDQYAAVHGHGDTGIFEKTSGTLVHDPLLHEKEPGSPGDRLFGDGGHLVGSAVHVHDVDRDVRGHLLERPVARLPEDPGVARVDRDDPVTLLHQVAGDGVRGPLRVRRTADDGDRPRALERRADLYGVVHRVPSGRASFSGRIL